MGIFSKLKAKWKVVSTEDKIGLVIDVISMIGGGAIGGAIGDIAAAHTKNRFIAVCEKVTAVGIGCAISDVASKELREEYGQPLAGVIDRIREKTREKNEKEEVTNA